jgi:hypothetical protein
MGLFGKKKSTEEVALGPPVEEQGVFNFGTTPAYQDPALSYASRGSATQLGFLHVPSGKTTYFMAFVTDFSDQFTSEWNEENVYGRMDPIPTFQRTGRKISVGWDIPADSYNSGYMNLVKCQGLLKFLYPNYSMNDNANSISQAPIIRMKFANMIARSRGNNLVENGLLGYLGGMSFAPDMEAGFFDGPNGHGNPAARTATAIPPMQNFMSYVGASGDSAIAPKVIKLSCDFTVLHERQLGWGDDKEWIDKANDGFFPYQIPSGTDQDNVFTGGGDFQNNVDTAQFSTIGDGSLGINNLAQGDDNPDAKADERAVI